MGVVFPVVLLWENIKLMGLPDMTDQGPSTLQVTFHFVTSPPSVPIIWKIW
jgi:hypothetical protein